MTDHIRTTEHILGELGLSTKRTLLVLNKCDRLEEAERARLAWERNAVAISAMDPQTLRPLLLRMEDLLFDGRAGSLLEEPEAELDDELELAPHVL